ncbi:OprO/OprP family phosphate-selective porin [Luteibacter aegosomatis]|uniref:OprO/OprP family phosphate-selective porin n=1 Tax=Luteibacter aegosomatis TaxID=2911537 RepID=UPI001FFBCEFE|nr:porin [Luteibacter aegosomatis]UPG84499.1 OprO/OprP family phosphate-selective porin [Luteibacter aegosomatis]
MRNTPRLYVAIAAVLLAGPTFAADTVSNAELLKLIKAQAAEISDLKKRLAAVEHERQPTATAPSVASVTPATPPPNHDAQVEAAIADTRESELAVALARGTGGGGSSSNSVRWGRGGEAGPTFRSDDGYFSFKPNGRLLIDFTRTGGSSYDTRNISGAQITSARLGGEGTIGALGYHVEADFADNEVALRQTYLTYATKLFGHTAKFYLGNFLKDLGTEGSSESARVPFMLRNAATAVGQPVVSYFGMGAQMRVYGDNWHYSLSVNGNAPNSSTSGKNTDSTTYLTRAHWNPIKTSDGFLHVGSWYYYEKISDGVTSINNTPAIALDYNDNLAVSASSIANPTQDRGKGFELGGVFRNFWMMNEYGKRTIDSSTADSVSRHGSSFAAGWMITGEAPGFSSRSGSWKAVKVNHPVTSGGWGAFELAGRVDHYDYADAPRGGKGKSYTLGLNWYLNDWSRLMLNYIHWDTDNKVGSFQGPDTGNSIGMRAQVVF